ncbi:MAG: single-stranded DNA-binding protein [Nevskiaceae bacterium]|nr:MAG: single-stranded DNA-binding protein [Nevskiaceae bacterium]
MSEALVLPLPVERSPAQVRPIATPAELLRLVVEQNSSMEKIQQMMDLQDRWEAAQARKAFNGAMAKFREAHVKVTRSATVEQGPLKGTTYAKLSDFVSAAAPALSAAGLSVSWLITRDEEKWLEVACIVRHVDGHDERTVMGGPPDVGGAKNAIQARASTVSYLEKYTLKMALGLAEQDDDDDGNGGPRNGHPEPSAASQSPQSPQPPRPPSPPEKPPYPDASIEANHDAWLAVVESGRKTPDQLIATIETRNSLTDGQKRRIRALAK